MVVNYFYISGAEDEREIRSRLEEKNCAVIGGERYSIRRRIAMVQSNDRRKVIVLEEIDMRDRVELRLAYYIKGRRGRARNRWVWGQFASMMPPQDLRKLIEKAREIGML